MTLNRSLCLLACVASLAACGAGSPETPEDFARAAFEALAAGNHDEFMKFAPTEDDTKWMYDKSMEAGGKAAASAAQYFERSGGIAGVTKGMRESVSKSFSDTRRAVAALFNLADATFEKVDKVNTRNKGGVDQTDIWFKVGAAGKTYRFKLDDCTKTDGGWIVTDEIKFIGG